jgi:ribosomal protein L40E
MCRRFRWEACGLHGIVALGAERDAGRIATALAECDDPAFFAVGDAFLGTHYVARLGAVALCEECGARNDVDAPYERECGGESERESESEGESQGAFPAFEGFAARARVLAEPRMAEIEGIELVVEGGTPAVDDGGEPLLGSYVPPHPGDAGTPTQAPVVTVYYRTFRAMWDEDGPYDWDDELAETIEHELEHHVSFLRGDDPTDDEERAVIRDEAMRIVGKREAGRRALQGFGASWGDFLRRTWPIWVLAILALVFTLVTQR